MNPVDISKQAIDKIFSEGDSIIPIGQRNDFKMIYIDLHG